MGSCIFRIILKGENMLVGKKLRLREIREEDIKKFWLWKNDPKNYEFFYELSPITLEQHKGWISKVSSDPSEVMFAIENIEKELCVGTVGFQHWDKRNRKAEWGRLLVGDRDNAPKGSGREIEALMLEYGFEHMGLNKLFCEVLSSNGRVVNLHKKFGFKEEGLYKNHVLKNGEFVDVVYLALHQEDYFKNKEEIYKYLR